VLRKVAAFDGQTMRLATDNNGRRRRVAIEVDPGELLAVVDRALRAPGLPSRDSRRARTSTVASAIRAGVIAARQPLC
jgi:hypothetical protein